MHALWTVKSRKTNFTDVLKGESLSVREWEIFVRIGFTNGVQYCNNVDTGMFSLLCFVSDAFFTS